MHARTHARKHLWLCGMAVALLMPRGDIAQRRTHQRVYKAAAQVSMRGCACVCACIHDCERVHMRACVCTCVHACVRVCVHARACARACVHA